MQGARPLPRLAFGAGITPGERELPEETAVALSFNGSTQAVMMATPADLEDFAYGFALTEGIATPAEIEAVEVARGPRGIDVQTWLVPAAEARLATRRRTMAGPVGCGLCGIDSIEQALRDLPVDSRGTRLSDIADVNLRPQRMSYVRKMEGKPSVGVDIYKERSANLVDLSRTVGKEVEALRQDPAMHGVDIEVAWDSGKAVTSSLLALAEAGAIGLVL